MEKIKIEFSFLKSPICNKINLKMTASTEIKSSPFEPKFKKLDPGTIFIAANDEEILKFDETLEVNNKPNPELISSWDQKDFHLENGKLLSQILGERDWINDFENYYCFNIDDVRQYVNRKIPCDTLEDIKKDPRAILFSQEPTIAMWVYVLDNYPTFISFFRSKICIKEISEIIVSNFNRATFYGNEYISKLYIDYVFNSPFFVDYYTKQKISFEEVFLYTQNKEYSYYVGRYHKGSHIRVPDKIINSKEPEKKEAYLIPLLRGLLENPDAEAVVRFLKNYKNSIDYTKMANNGSLIITTEQAINFIEKDREVVNLILKFHPENTIDELLNTIREKFSDIDEYLLAKWVRKPEEKLPETKEEIKQALSKLLDILLKQVE